ncbi:endonuclease/exonuclease/phosphatase family protein [bacterium]|nr:MAG: endonuclease/exonuclease/phosphatase family protein [bacterium]
MTITVLQWNTWYQENVHHIAGFLAEHPADIMTLQELTIGDPHQDVPNSPDFLAAALGYHAQYKDMPFEAPDGTTLTLASTILSKHPIGTTKTIWFSQPGASEAIADKYRAYVEATIELPDGTEITVGTAAASYTENFTNSVAKDVETERLLGLIGARQQRYIFGGDLGATPPSHTYEDFCQILEPRGPNPVEPTWTTKPFGQNQYDVHELAWRLDYLFSTPDLRQTAAEVLETPYSNHLPITATFEDYI